MHLHSSEVVAVPAALGSLSATDVQNVANDALWKMLSENSSEHRDGDRMKMKEARDYYLGFVDDCLLLATIEKDVAPLLPHQFYAYDINCSLFDFDAQSLIPKGEFFSGCQL